VHSASHLPTRLPLQDLADFQRDKQARLNRVPAVVTLKAHAVQLPAGVAGLPKDLSGGLARHPGSPGGPLGQRRALACARTPSISHLPWPNPAERSGPPAGGLVISAGAIERLQRRLGELAAERAALKDGHRSLQRQAAQLAADKAAKEAKLAELRGRCKEVRGGRIYQSGLGQAE
jgi:hypothetical protein